jgi:hypothetical protein
VRVAERIDAPVPRPDPSEDRPTTRLHGVVQKEVVRGPGEAGSRWRYFAAGQ